MLCSNGLFRRGTSWRLKCFSIDYFDKSKQADSPKLLNTYAHCFSSCLVYIAKIKKIAKQNRHSNFQLCFLLNNYSLLLMTMRVNFQSIFIKLTIAEFPYRICEGKRLSNAIQEQCNSKRQSFLALIARANINMRLCWQIIFREGELYLRKS